MSNHRAFMKNLTSGFSTNAIHVPYEPERSRMAVGPPITTTTLFRQDEPETFVNYYYGRCGNPTREHLEKCLASLEGAKYSVTFSSGLAAIASVVGMLKSGDHLLSALNIYSGTTYLFGELKNINVEYDAVAITDLESVKKAMKPNTKVVFFETPTNPVLDVVDIKMYCKIIHSQPNAIAVVDNTFLTPYFQKPLDLGADIVVYSLSKYMNGHSDVVMGAAVTNNESIHERLKFIQKVYGAVPSPFDCYQVTRGLKTLAIRMEQQCKASLEIAEFLQSHPSIEKVIHPGLPSHPQYKLSLKQFNGRSGMVSFGVKGGMKAAKTFVQSLKVVILVSSLGGVESKVSIPSLMTHSEIPKETRMKLGITDNLVRLSVGLEDVKDLVQDIDQALKLSQQGKFKL